MSDPQINIEIEDVLASIRRLVSEGEAPRRPVPTAAAEPSDVPDVAPNSLPETEIANSPAAPDKLVLSPEQMVSVPGPAPQQTPKSAPLLLMPQALEDAAEEEPSAALEEAASPATDDPVVEVSSAEQDFAPPVTPDEADLAAPQTEDVSEPVVAAPQTTRPEVPPLSEVEAMWHSVRSSPVAPDTAAPTSGKADLLSTIAELEAAVSDATDEFEPDGSETTPVVDWAETTANGAIFGARASTTRIADVADLAGELAGHSQVEEAAPDQPAKLAEEIVAEAVIDAEAEDLAARLDEDLAQYLEAGTTIDEDAMRDMVRDIIRQELQGALGERITRNVRKLVRREIYRVMASEEFS